MDLLCAMDAIATQRVQPIFARRSVIALSRGGYWAKIGTVPCPLPAQPGAHNRGRPPQHVVVAVLFGVGAHQIAAEA